MHFLMPLVRDKNSSTEYVEFLKLLDDKYPKEDKIRIVLDNLKVHTSEATRKYLVTVPERFEFVFTPKHGSWLNMVEGFFSVRCSEVSVLNLRRNLLIVSIGILQK